MKDAPVVEVKDVCLAYHEPHAETPAIDHLSFSVDRGEFISIVGPSGCGKTSILSVLAGLIPPSSGEALICGRPAGTAASGVGYMLQRDHLLDWRTIEGNTLLGLEVKGLLNKNTREHTMELLNRYGLGEFRRCYPRQLSGGMRQKVALIRTLAFSPEILLLDEPFSALDYQTRLRVADEIRAIIRSEGSTAMLVTHDIAEAISMSDRVLVFTARPAAMRAEHIIGLSAGPSPLARRNAQEFKTYFDTIWKELDNGEPGA